MEVTLMTLMNHENEQAEALGTAPAHVPPTVCDLEEIDSQGKAAPCGL